MHGIEMLQVLNERAAAIELGVARLEDMLLERYAVPDTIERIYAMAKDEGEYLSAAGSR